MHRNLRVSGRLLVWACALALTAPLLAQTAPSIQLQPTGGPGGTSFAVIGSGFVGNCGVDVRLGSATGLLLASTGVETDGSFRVEITSPDGSPPGEYLVVAVGKKLSGEFCTDVTGPEASATFTVTGATPTDPRIYLKGRVLDAPGVDLDFIAEIAASPVPLHAVVQLAKLPTAKGDEIERLQSLGITLLGYLNGMEGLGTGYLASISPGLDPAAMDLVTGLQRLVLEDKLNNDLVPSPAEGTGTWALLVHVFADVDEQRARDLFGSLGIDPAPAGPHSWAVVVDGGVVPSLLTADIVQYIESGPGPFEELVDEVRAAGNVDAVQDLDTGTGVYGGLSGDGVQIGVMDSGVDSDHQDFAGRIIRFDEPGGDHGTHVASIAAGSGAQSNGVDDDGVANGGTAFQWRGMAPEAQIAAYGSAGGSVPTFDDAINNFGMDVSNHSYVTGSGVQAQYSSDAATLDSLIRGDVAGVPARPMVWASGNNATVGPRDCDDNPATPDEIRPQYPKACGSPFQAGYFSSFASCKNCLVVANLQKSLIHAPSSSMGPTMDGRLKPELAAIGTSVRAAGADTDGDGNPATGNGYRSKSGTSMASPAIAGIVALVLEQYAQSLGIDLDLAPPLPSTVKAVLVQTAQDLEGTDPTSNFDTGAAVSYGPGPDWATGYGLADAQAATELIDAGFFLEDSLSAADNTDTHLASVVPGQEELRVTLAWDDRPGTPNANDAAAQLVNDLDLWLVDPDGAVHRPLVLPLLTPNDCDGNAANGVQVGTCIGQDAAGQNYFGPAAEGTDRRNNLEQVVVADASGLEPGNWSVWVSVLNDDGLTVRLPLGGSQPYSLAGVTVARSDLRVVKTDLPDPVAAGTALTYTITVTNDGPDEASGVVLEDDLPAGVQFSSATAGCSATGAVVRCELGDLAPAASAQVEIVVLVDANLVHDAGGPVTLTNAAVAFAATPDDDPSDNRDEETTDVVAVADLEIVSFEVVNPPAEILVGEDVQVVLRKRIRNNGPSAPMDVAVHVDATASPGTVVTPEMVDLLEPAVGLGEEREFDEAFQLRCEDFSHHSFHFVNTIAPADPLDIDPDLSNNTAEITLDVECILPITINIKPGSDPNSIQPKNNGSIPVALLTDPGIESADLTGDGQIDGFDLAIFASRFGGSGEGLGDLDRDLLVDGADLSILAALFGKEAVLSLAFDATTVDPLSVRFGPREVVWDETGGAFERHGKGHIEDSYELDEVTQDGDLDMVLHFIAQETGIELDDVEACVKGTFYDAQGDPHTFFGCDAIRIVPGASKGNKNGHGP